MPRTKESDDENEVKTGRRSRAVTGTNVVDSPLRRSTRNRQQINQDVSPDTANNAAGPLTRTTRRKAASQEATTTETTRTLRSRKTSITSDTSENHDLETYDVKRTTRKSTTAAAAPETPTSVRIRRSIRAGSESKTIQSPARTTRKTRASSLDLEERNDAQSNLQTTHNSTPIKSRKRASALPSEPVLIEETEKYHKDPLEESLRSMMEDDQKEDNSKEDGSNIVDSSVKTMDSTQSPVLRLNMSRSVTPEVQKDTEKLNENSDNLLATALKPSSGFVLKSILEEANDSQSKEETEILNESSNNVNEIINAHTPKVIVEKIRYPFNNEDSEPLEKSPSNKENEKFNATIPVKKILKFPSSHEVPTQRKSLVTMASKKVSIMERLNKSIDDRMLTSAEDSSKISSPVSKRSLENFPDVESVGENIFSVSSGLKNESVIIMENIKKPTNYIETSDNNIDIEQELSLMDTSNNSSIDIKNDVPDKAFKENNEIKQTSLQDNEASMMIVDEEEINTLTEKSQIIDQQPDVTPTLVSPQKTEKEHELSSSITEEAKNDEEIISEHEEINKENTKNKSLLNEYSSPLKQADIDLEEFNKMTENESDSDLSKLFQDIPADEWNNEETSQSSEKNNPAENDKSNDMENEENKNVEKKKEEKTEKDTVDNFELVLVDKKAWEAAEQERLKKMEIINDFDSTDTILMQSMGSKKSIDPPASPPFEEPMDTGGDETETEVEPAVEVNINKSRTSLSKQISAYEQFLNQSNKDNKNDYGKEETSNLNKSNASEKKTPIKRLTPIKIGPPKEMKEASPAKTVTDGNILRTRKSLDSSLLKKKSPKDFLNTSLQTRKSLNNTIWLDGTDDSEPGEQDEKKCTPKSPKNVMKKSLNKSKSADDLAMDTDEDEIDQQEEKKLPSKSSKNINKSLVKSTPCSPNNQNLNSSKSKLLRNFSIVAQVNSDSEVDSLDSESSDRSSPVLPAFLFDDRSSSNESEEGDSSTIDSDVAREYNLNGSSISEYSDDDVQGDNCRASETESSESEDDSEDDDMSDFIVDDEEEESVSEDNEDDEERQKISDGDEDENVSNEEDSENTGNDDEDEGEIESEESENEDDEDMDVAEKLKEIELRQGSEPDDISQIRSVKKHLEFDSTTEHNENEPLDKYRNTLTKSESKVLLKNKARQSWNELCNDSLENKTPKKEAKQLAGTEDGEKKKMSSKKKSRVSDVSELNKSGSNKSDTPKSVKSTKKNRSLNTSEINIDNSFHVEDIIPTTSKLSQTSSFNKSMLVPFTTSPEIQSLLKEKFNDTLPALKLEQRGKGRRSTLFFVEENVNDDEKNADDEDDEPMEVNISRKAIDKEKKKKRKIATNGFDVEDISTEFEDSPILPKSVSKNLNKKKKKKAEEKNSSLISKGSNVSLKKKKKEEWSEEEVEEIPLKKKKNKQKSVPVEASEITNKKRTKTENNVVLKRTKRLSSETYFTAEETESNFVKVVKDSKKMNKSKGKLSRKANSEMEKSSASIPSTSLAKSRVKRLPEDVIESLSDVPVQPKKRRKLSVDQKILPSRKMFDSRHPQPDNISIEDEGFIPLSSSGGTTSFYVMNLEKPKKSRKLAAVYSFRERMLSRNPRQPVSAYLMYQQKLKALNNDKY